MPAEKLPAYRLHKSSGQAIVRIRLGPKKSKMFYLGKYGSDASYAKYEEKLAEWRHGRLYDRVEVPSVDELVAAFMEWAPAITSKLARSPASQRRYRR